MTIAINAFFPHQQCATHAKMDRLTVFDDNCELIHLRQRISASDVQIDISGTFLVFGSALSSLVRIMKLPKKLDTYCDRHVFQTVRAPGTVNKVAVSKEAQLILAACSTGDVAIWARCCENYKRKALVRRLLSKASGVAVDASGNVMAAAFTDGGVIGPSELVIYDSSHPEKPVPMRTFKQNSPLGTVCISADARVVAFTKGYGASACVNFAGVARDSGDIHSIDLPSALRPAIGISPDGRTVVACGIFRHCTRVKLLESSAPLNGPLVYRVSRDSPDPVHLGGVPYAAAGQGGDFIVGGLGGYNLFNVQGLKVFELGETLVREANLTERFDLVTGTMFRRDNQSTVVVGCCRDGYVRFWRFDENDRRRRW